MRRSPCSARSSRASVGGVELGFSLSFKAWVWTGVRVSDDRELQRTRCGLAALQHTTKSGTGKRNRETSPNGQTPLASPRSSPRDARERAPHFLSALARVRVRPKTKKRPQRVQAHTPERKTTPKNHTSPDEEITNIRYIYICAGRGRQPVPRGADRGARRARGDHHGRHHLRRPSGEKPSVKKRNFGNTIFKDVFFPPKTKFSKNDIKNENSNPETCRWPRPSKPSA